MLAPVSRFSRGQRWLLGTVLVVVLLLLWFFVWRSPAEKLPPPPNPWMSPVPVRTVTAVRADLKVHIKAIGTVTPLNTVTVRSRVDGPLTQVSFQEGQRVEAGALLAEIDPAPFRVRLAQVEGTLQETRAQLRTAEEDLVMYKRLFEQRSIPKQQLDKQEALVEQFKGTLKNHQAQVDDAKLQLSYTRIEAPIAGRLGLRRIDVGNMINASSTEGLVSITQTQPIAVMFTIPENQLVAVRQSYRTAAEGEQRLPVEAWDRNEQQQLATGELVTLDNQIDAATGTLRLKAEFANEDDLLFPNQFVNVRLHLQTLSNALTIPVDAVQFGSQGTYVYTIEDDKAKIRLIKPGPTEGARVAIEDGLEEGEVVVLEGIDRLNEGRAVKITE